MEPNCAEHKKEILGCSDMKELAEMIVDLHYEALENLLGHLGQKLWVDAKKDEAAGRSNLSISLAKASNKISAARLDIWNAWQISMPFMDSNK